MNDRIATVNEANIAVSRRGIRPRPVHIHQRRDRGNHRHDEQKVKNEGNHGNPSEKGRKILATAGGTRIAQGSLAR